MTVQKEQLPEDENEVRRRHESNRIAWNEGAVHYTETLEWAIEQLRSRNSNLHPIERRNLARLGELRDWCKLAVHLQCASGRDTLSLWLEGVPAVVGVDISDVHIDNARKMSAAVDAPATWHCCDILDTPHSVDGTADLVYTGRGAICWLQDLDLWAAVVFRLLKPGGVFHILDDHPVSWLFDADAPELRYSGTSYFGTAESSKGWPDTYIGELAIPLEEQARKYERLWTISEIHNALVRAGLVIEYLGEHTDPYWDIFINLPPEQQGKIPLTFSILARRPVE
jgi:SAM-dependent methyltransferase